MAEKKLDIRLMFDCRDNFMTQEHYQLMTILKNLVGNAVEAIESTKKWDDLDSGVQKMAIMCLK